MPNGDITLGELARSFHSLEDRMNQRFDQVEKQLGSIQFVHRQVWEVEKQALKEEIRVERDRINQLVEDKKWLQRAVVGAFIGVAVSAFMAVAAAGGGF